MPTSPLASPHATRDVLERHGLATRKRLGQHFLVDDNIVKRTLELAAISDTDTVLEVGPGIGTLTLALCDAAALVIAIEMDERLADVLSDTTVACHNLKVILADAMKLPTTELTDRAAPPTVFVSNLPYSVAATLVLRFVATIPTLRSTTVMVQAEVADRMSAEPGTKAYGAYTVKLAFHARVEGRFAVPRTCFMPQPRVDSSVIRLVPRDEPPDPELVQAASTVTDAAFCQRRKTLRNSLSGGLGVPTKTAEELLAASGIDPARRAETLLPRDFLTIGSNALENRLLP